MTSRQGERRGQKSANETPALQQDVVRNTKTRRRQEHKQKRTPQSSLSALTKQIEGHEALDHARALKFNVR